MSEGTLRSLQIVLTLPFFEIFEATVRTGGAGKVADTESEGVAATSREYVLRPLGSVESVGSERRRVKLLWPFIDVSWGAGDVRAWAMPIFFYRERPVPQLNESDIDFMLFPLIYAGYEPGAGGYFGIFPLGGKLRGEHAVIDTAAGRGFDMPGSFPHHENAVSEAPLQEAERKHAALNRARGSVGALYQIGAREKLSEHHRPVTTTKKSDFGATLTKRDHPRETFRRPFLPEVNLDLPCGQRKFCLHTE